MKKIILSLQHSPAKLFGAIVISGVLCTSCGKTVEEPLDVLQQVASDINVSSMAPKGGIIIWPDTTKTGIKAPVTGIVKSGQ